MLTIGEPCGVAEDSAVPGERFDLILTDLMMPQMTGMELHAKLCDVAPDQADGMVFMTGGAFNDSSRDFLDNVSNPHLDKPFDHQYLLGLINQRVR